jgi:hypothetical protein
MELVRGNDILKVLQELYVAIKDFTSAAGKGKRSSRRVSEGAAILYDSRMELVRGNNIFEGVAGVVCAYRCS